jgi:hypothetical protein
MNAVIIHHILFKDCTDSYYCIFGPRAMIKVFKQTLIEKDQRSVL